MDNINKSFWHGRFMRYVPLILWIGVIGFMSSGQASMSETSRFIGPILQFLFPDLPEESRLIYHGYIRKLAHVTEYAVLAFFSARAFSTSSKPSLKNYWYAFSLGLVAVVASIDEINQSFNAARTGSPFDVLIDCFGGLLMVVFILIFKFLRRKPKVN